MRLLEGVLLGAFVPVLLVALLPRAARTGRWYLLGLPAAAAAAQLLVEGPRWQLVPAYGLVALIPVAALLRSGIGGRLLVGRWAGVLGSVVTATIVGFSGWLAVAFPVFRLPSPTGNHAVGITRFHFTDSSRSELLTADPDDVRELSAWAWYPAENTTNAVRQVYWEQPRVLGRLLATSFALPPYLFDHVGLTRTHSFRDPPVAGDQERYPVVLFSHGYGRGFFAQNSVQMEDLASRGFIAISIVHPYEALAMLRPDDSVIPYSAPRIDAFYTEMTPLTDAYLAASGRAEREEALLRLLQPGTIAEQSVRLWTADTRFVMDELERIDALGPGPLRGHLDLNRIGVFGHSFGGSVAVQVCLEDVRCRAGVNIDGVPYGDLLTSRLEQPFMFMYSDRSRGVSEIFLPHLGNVLYQVGISGTVHNDYTDFTLMAPTFKSLGKLGPIEGRRMAEIVTAYLGVFFDAHLKGLASPLLNAPSPGFPEVTFRRDGSE